MKRKEEKKKGTEPNLTTKREPKQKNSRKRMPNSLTIGFRLPPEKKGWEGGGGLGTRFQAKKENRREKKKKREKKREKREKEKKMKKKNLKK